MKRPIETAHGFINPCEAHNEVVDGCLYCEAHEVAQLIETHGRSRDFDRRIDTIIKRRDTMKEKPPVIILGDSKTWKWYSCPKHRWENDVSVEGCFGCESYDLVVKLRDGKISVEEFRASCDAKIIERDGKATA